MAPPPVSLGLHHILREEDLFRALFCSIAAYKDNAEAQIFLNQIAVGFPHATFDKVDMSRDFGQNFLVAYSGDDVFIAFKGTESLSDVASDIMVSSHSKFGGSLHRGFFERSTIFMASDLLEYNPLPGLISSGKRIIFCGHSLGGAVAHMVLLRFWLESDELPSSVAYPDSLFSIAFGAPFICDDKAAALIYKTENLKWRFINFVNQCDPVPLMLQHLSRTIAGGLRGLFAEADSILQSLGGFVGQTIKSFEKGVVEGMKTGVREACHLTVRAPAAVMQQSVLLGDSLKASSTPNSSASEVPEKPDFHPIGQYIFLVLKADREGTTWNVEKYMGGAPSLQPLLSKELKFSKENLEQHRMGSYQLVLSDIYGPNARGDVISSLSRQLSTLQVRTPAPKVTFAEWIFVESVPEYISVKGENLLFLRAAVSVSGLEQLRIKEQKDTQLMLIRPSRRQELNIPDKAMSNVIIKTAFGVTSHPILEDRSYNTKEMGVSKMISRVVQVLNVKATPPLSSRPTERVLTCLDDMMNCVPGLNGRRISEKIGQITECRDHDISGGVENHYKEINYMIETVVKYLRSSLKVKFSKSERLRELMKLAESLLANSTVKVCWSLIAFVGVASLPLDSVFGAAVTVTVAVVTGYLILGPSEVIISGYDLVLKSAIEEASKWSEMGQSMGNDVHSQESRIFDLEKELTRQVEGSPIFKEMVKKAHSTSIEDVPNFKSAAFKVATPESRLKLLKRIKLICDTISLYNTEVAQVHFIGIFGAEDAGKSTFIKKVLKSRFPDDAQPSLPVTGFDTHTSIVRPYRLGPSLWMVDFPGSNGAGPYADMWKQFTALSSSSVLFLEFQFDVKKEQVKMYREMKKNLGDGTQVAIVFNQVDRRFKPRDQRIFTTQYFMDLRKKIEDKLGCTGSKDRIYFATVEPDIEEEDLTKLKGMGILDFEELQKELVESAQSSTLPA